jgi:hypothetical protein
MHRLTSRSGFFAKGSLHICQEAVTVHFSVVLELVHNVELSKVPHYWRHKLVSLNLPLHNC